jgi:hypothetical protein
MEPESVMLPHHLEQLIQGSGIAAEIIAARGYRSIHGPEGYTELKRLGLSRPQAKLTPGLLVPILGGNGEPVLYQYRPDEPWIDAKGKTIKYETPRGERNCLDFGTGQCDLIGNPTVDLWGTEGIKKVDALRSHGLCAPGLTGVYGWRGTNLDGGKVALADWELVALNGRAVYLCFDSDVTTKREVQQALTRLKRFLAQRGARVTVVLLPAEGPEKVGVDDYLVSHSLDELQTLAHPQQPTHETPLAPTPYRATSHGLVWLKSTRDGDIDVPLTNFVATVAGDIPSDNGAETSRHFEIDATMCGRARRFTVTAGQSPSLSRVSEYLGASAIVYPGQTLKDDARTAIQILGRGDESQPLQSAHAEAPAADTGDLQAVKHRLWAVLLSSYDGIVEEADPQVRRAHYYAFTAIVSAYSKPIEVGELEARIAALEAAAEAERNGYHAPL